MNNPIKTRQSLALTELDFGIILLFALMALLVTTTEITSGIDSWGAEFISWFPTWTITTSLWIDSITTLTVSTTAIILLTFFISYLDGWRVAAAFILTALLAILAAHMIKDIFLVARPEGALIAHDSYAFPSGHSTMALFLAGTLSVAFGRVVTKNQRIWLAIFLYTGAIITALSRLLIQVHTISDVIAGALLGLFFAILFKIILNRYERQN